MTEMPDTLRLALDLAELALKLATDRGENALSGAVRADALETIRTQIRRLRTVQASSSPPLFNG